MKTTTTSRMFRRVGSLSTQEICQLMAQYHLGKNPFGSLLEEIAVKAKYEALLHNNHTERDFEPAQTFWKCWKGKET